MPIEPSSSSSPISPLAQQSSPNHPLFDIYTQFCAFGQSKIQLASLETSSLLPTMDNVKFAKFCKDCSIIDAKRVASIDVDILFNKAKEKGSRRLDWDSFQVAFTSLALLKFEGIYSSEREARDALIKWCMNKRPQVRGTTAPSVGIFDRLTDVSKYTGTHKLRFNSDGSGRGLAGRDRPSPTASLSSIVDRSANYGSGYLRPKSFK